MAKTKWLLSQNGRNWGDLVVCGGVAANCYLNHKMHELAALFGKRCFVPSVKYCTDNGSMVAYSAFLQIKYQQFVADNNVKPRWPLDRLLFSQK